jgi:hypothetical protein
LSRATLSHNDCTSAYSTPTIGVPAVSFGPGGLVALRGRAARALDLLAHGAGKREAPPLHVVRERHRDARSLHLDRAVMTVDRELRRILEVAQLILDPEQRRSLRVVHDDGFVLAAAAAAAALAGRLGLERPDRLAQLARALLALLDIDIDIRVAVVVVRRRGARQHEQRGERQPLAPARDAVHARGQL